jgi:antitoxin HigA-1
MMDIRFARPIHPGEMLREEFMVPLHLTAGKLAKAIGVPRTRIERLAREETILTGDTAVRLAQYFGSSVGFWMNMQTQYELDCLHADDKRLAEVRAIIPLPRPDLAEAAA